MHRTPIWTALAFFWLVACSGTSTPSAGAVPAHDASVAHAPTAASAGASGVDASDIHDGSASDGGSASPPPVGGQAGLGSGGAAGDAPPSAADSCAGDGAPANGRRLGLDLLDVNAAESFETNLALAEQLHVSYLTLHLPWTAIETTAGAGETSGVLVDPDSALSSFAAIAARDGIALSLTLRPIDATGKTVPADLAQTRFSDTALITRFERVIDFALEKLPQSALVSLMIGNEIDNYDPGADADFWVDYGQFLGALRAHVAQRHPGLKLGFTATFAGLTDPMRKTANGWPAQQIMQTFAQQVDLVGVTYYAVSADFVHRSPDAPHQDLSLLTAAVPMERPIAIQEAGYATAAGTGSSESAQARFFCELFRAWDRHATRIPLLAVLRLNDVTDAKARELAGPYGLGTPAFIEYLRTLGLRSVSGANKPAFSSVEHAAKLRGM